MDFLDIHLVTGAAVGATLLSAVAFVPLARNVALAAAAGSIVTAYLRGGVDEILNVATSVREQVFAHPSFAIGVVGGVFLAAIIATQRTQRVAD